MWVAAFALIGASCQAVIIGSGSNVWVIAALEVAAVPSVRRLPRGV